MEIRSNLRRAGAVIAFAACGLPAHQSQVEVPFDFRGPRSIVVRGSICNSHPADMMIDTGSSLTVIDRRLAARLRLTRIPNRPNVADTSGRERVYEMVVVPNLRIGPIDIPVSCIAAEIPIHNVDLIVGLNVLRRSSFAIDFEAKQIRFGPARGNGSCMPFDTEALLITMPVHLDDQPLTLVVDSGAEYVCIYSERLDARVGPADRRMAVAMLHLTGRSRGAWARVKSFRLGPDLWNRLGILVTNNSRRGRPFDGVLSLASLELRWVHFDCRSGLMCWERE